MKFGSTVLLSVLVTTKCCCDAFTIHSQSLSSKNSITTITSRIIESSEPSLFVPTSKSLTTSINKKQQYQSLLLQMVAGGAERAYGDEYYEGLYILI
jgi:hypothetical protein